MNREEKMQEEKKKSEEEKSHKYEIKLKNPGDAIRSMGKLLANSAYGQTLMANHDEQIEFINNIEQQYKFMDENNLDSIITNDEDEDGYHVFIGNKKMNETKNLTSRSRFLGSFVLSYSRLMLDDIINAVHGKDRFNENIIEKQVYYGDTDSILCHIDLVKKLEKSGFIGENNGDLTDDLNKDFYIKKDVYEYSKVVDYCAAAPKKYSLVCVTPKNEIKSKTKINGINQKNCILKIL